MSKIFFKKAVLFFKVAVFSFENQIFAQFLFQKKLQTIGKRAPNRLNSRAICLESKFACCYVFLKNSIRSESGAGVRRTFDHNLWEL